jgi:hypothetical protein
MIRQVKTENRKGQSVMRGAAFVRGFKEARKGKPLDYDAYPHNTNQQWDYERGRQFALVYAGALKQGSRLTYEAQVSFQDSVRLKYIF